MMAQWFYIDIILEGDQREMVHGDAWAVTAAASLKGHGGWWREGEDEGL